MRLFPGPGGTLLLGAALGVACLSLLAVMRPAYLVDCIPADESAARATLHNIAAALQAFRAAGHVDADGDGRGEAGFFEELCGLPTAGRPTASVPHEALLGEAFAAPVAGRVHRSGYWFQVFLAGRDGTWIGDGAHAARVDTDAAETTFCICAWPDGSVARRPAFCRDETESTYECRDRERYRGAGCAPAGDAARPADAGSVDTGWHTGRDGAVWVAVD